MKERILVFSALLALFGCITIGESFAINTAFVVAVLLYLLVAWYTRSALLFYSGYLVLSCWNLGNGLLSTNLVLDGAIIAVLVKRLSSRDLQIWYSRVRVLLVVFLISGLLILLLGGKHSLNIVHLQIQGLLFGLLCSLEERPLLSIMPDVLRIFGAFLSLYCFVEAIFGSASRMEGPHQSATAFGVAIALTFSLLFPCDFFGKRLLQFTSYPILIGLVAAIILTGTRAALLAVGLTVFTTLLQVFGRKISAASVLKATFVVGIIAFGIWQFLPEDSAVKQGLNVFSRGKIDVSAFGRLVAWKYAIEFFKSSPLFGIGIGQFYHNFPEIPMIGQLQHAHSLYLNTLAETGLSGALILFSLIGISLKRSWANRGHSDFGLIAKSLLVCAITTLFLGCFDTVPYYPSLLGLAWFQYAGYLRLPNGTF